MVLRYRRDVAKGLQNDEYLVNSSGPGADIVNGCLRPQLRSKKEASQARDLFVRKNRGRFAWLAQVLRRANCARLRMTNFLFCFEIIFSVSRGLNACYYFTQD
jgi:hypothetical protein